ncbi:ATP-binding protein [Streptomyces sp. NPDC059866]|uniref:ATP-binding protein n=1 Tax=Streptomyces sp. NPDC059866 TaxID=3346978 RepID=UPI00364DAB54
MHSTCSPLFQVLVRTTPVRKLPPSALAVKMARDTVVSRLKAWGLGAVVDTAILITSELVTNAVRVGGPVALRLAVVMDGGRRVLRLEVTDHGPGMSPTAIRCCLPDGDSCSGRGLPLINALAERWGNEQRAGAHQVWVHLAI